jgi:hypothetical protein
MRVPSTGDAERDADTRPHSSCGARPWLAEGMCPNGCGTRLTAGSDRPSGIASVARSFSERFVMGAW